MPGVILENNETAQDRLYMAASNNGGGRTQQNLGKNHRSSRSSWQAFSQTYTGGIRDSNPRRDEMEVIHNREHFRPLGHSCGPLYSSVKAEDSSQGKAPVLTFEELESDEYNMNHPYRGIAIIINNQHFDRGLELSERTGTNVDGWTLYAVFQEMGFSVRVHENQKVTEMVDILCEASKEHDYHRNSDCFMCAILSHGKKGAVYGTDGAIEVEELIKYFKGKTCPGLVGKPKIFFIQACQGEKFDEGVSLNVADAKGFMPNENITKIPTQADVLIAYSSVPGYYCWRNRKKGSWFIQALTEVLQKSWKKCDLLTILTRVNKKVAFDFKSATDDPRMNEMKQIPMFTSMLTKEVRFTPKE